MAHSPENHIKLIAGETEGPSFESMAEVVIEGSLRNATADPATQLALRFADLGIGLKGPASVVRPHLDLGPHPRLFSQVHTVKSSGLGYHDVRRALISYEDDEYVVTSRDWLVDLTVGTCCVLESRRLPHEPVTADCGPVVDTDEEGQQVVVEEGREYLHDFELIAPRMMESDAGMLSDFMADTHLFIGGTVSQLDTKNLNSYQHVMHS